MSRQVSRDKLSGDGRPSRSRSADVLGRGGDRDELGQSDTESIQLKMGNGLQIIHSKDCLESWVRRYIVLG